MKILARVMPSEPEIVANPRARSAVMRSAIRLPEDSQGAGA
jgi:16S rRNA C1402 N4-methylase RsmH